MPKYVTANSRKGRSLISPGREAMPWAVPKEIQEWNKRVEDEKKEKLRRKLESKGLKMP